MNSANLPNEFRAHTYPSFPSRNIIRQKSSNGGAWLVEFRDKQKKRLDTLLAPSQHDKLQQNRNEDEKKPKRSAVQIYKTLTKPYLIGRFLKHVKDQSSICSINLRGQSLHQAPENEDFGSFDCVVHIDASENRLTLECLKTFPSLCEVDLQLNGITRVLLDRNDFPNLSILDLSYNNIYEESIPNLGCLQSLKCLYLCSNGLKRLPTFDLSFEGSLDTTDCFPMLKILHLDDNELTEVSSFSKLAILKRLQILSLAGNRITCVPHPDASDPDSFVYDNKQWTRDMSTANVRHDVSAATLNNSRVVLDDSGSWKIGSTNDSFKGNQIAFPCLTTLDLSRNRLTKESGLLTLGFWPLLRKLIIHGNPIATASKETPPLIQQYLVKSFGIEVVRTERTKSSKRLPIARQVSASFKRNVVEDASKLLRRKPRYPTPSCPPLPSIEYTNSDVSSTTLEMDSSLSAENSEQEQSIRSVEIAQPPTEETNVSRKSPNNTTQTTNAEKKYEEDEKTTKNFFVTQVDLDDNEDNSTTQQTENLNFTNRYTPLLISDPFVEQEPMKRKYKGYEELITLTDDDKAFDKKTLPKTVSATVNQLSHALRYSIVFGHPSMKQTHRESVMKVVKRHNISSSSKRNSLVLNKEMKKTEEFTKALERMKADPLLLEESLDRVLSSKDRKLRHQFSEAPKLMAQVQKKYNQVLSRSIKAISNSKPENQFGINSRPPSITSPENTIDSFDSREGLSSKGTFDDIHNRVESRI